MYVLRLPTLVEFQGRSFGKMFQKSLDAYVLYSSVQSNSEGPGVKAGGYTEM